MGKWKEYQWITTASKKVGGPKNLIGILTGIGAAIGITATKIFNACKNKKNKEIIIDESVVYKIIQTGYINEDEKLYEGSTFKVINKDQDAVVIIVDNNENPVVAKYELLIKISNYK